MSAPSSPTDGQNATVHDPERVVSCTQCDVQLQVLPSQLSMRRRHVAVGGGKLWYVDGSEPGRWYCPKHQPVRVSTVDMGVVIPKDAPEHDPVNHPAHYNSAPATCAGCGRTIQCIDITRHLMFDPGNVIKYLWRKYFGGKNGEDDLEPIRKAIWYLTDELKRLGGKP